MLTFTALGKLLGARNVAGPVAVSSQACGAKVTMTVLWGAAAPQCRACSGARCSTIAEANTLEKPATT